MLGKQLAIAVLVLATAACTPPFGGDDRSDALTGDRTGTPRICVTPESGLDFGDVTVGHPKALTITLHNCGEVPATLSDFTIADESRAFSLVGAPGETMLEVGAALALEISFAPGGAGGREGTLLWTQGVGLGDVALRGNGVGDVSRPTLCVTPDELAFGEVIVGDTQFLDVTIENCGNDSVTIDEIALSNLQSFSLERAPRTAKTLAPGAKIEFLVGFAPNAGGAHTATVRWTSELGQGRLSVRGNGVVVAGVNNDPRTCVEFDKALTYSEQVGHRVGELSVVPPAENGNLRASLTITNNCAGPVFWVTSIDPSNPDCTGTAAECRYFGIVEDPSSDSQGLAPGESATIGYRFGTIPRAFDLIIFVQAPRGEQGTPQMAAVYFVDEIAAP